MTAELSGDRAANPSMVYTPPLRLHRDVVPDVMLGRRNERTSKPASVYSSIQPPCVVLAVVGGRLPGVYPSPTRTTSTLVDPTACIIGDAVGELKGVRDGVAVRVGVGGAEAVAVGAAETEGTTRATSYGADTTPRYSELASGRLTRLLVPVLVLNAYSA